MSRVVEQASRLAERGLGLHTLAVGGGLLVCLIATFQWDRPGIWTLAGFFSGLTSHGVLHVLFPGLDRRAHSAVMAGLVGGGLALDALVHRSWIVAGLAALALAWARWQGRVFFGRGLRR